MKEAGLAKKELIKNVNNDDRLTKEKIFFLLDKERHKGTFPLPLNHTKGRGTDVRT
jgi:hypothetical protein